jgi:hypothetical protein
MTDVKNSVCSGTVTVTAQTQGPLPWMVGKYYCAAVTQVEAESKDGRVVHSEYNQ